MFKTYNQTILASLLLYLPKMNFGLKYFWLLIILCSLSAFGQNNLIGIDQANKDIGTVENIYKVRVDFVIENLQNKNLYLLRADAEHGITIKTSKKTLKVNDTALIVIEFIPSNTGKFSHDIQLVTSADGKPFLLQVSGNIKSIKSDDKTACFYFSKPRKNNLNFKEEPIVVNEKQSPRDVSNKIPDYSTSPIESLPAHRVDSNYSDIVSSPKPELDPAKYKPNNIVFVVDVSNSMKDSLKLPLMKMALHHLVEVLRPEDQVSFITYADTTKLLAEHLTGMDKKTLDELIEKLRAKGLTKGNKAILFGQDIALKNYIPDGNNQIILVTDGKFRFWPEDQKKYKEKQGEKQVILSTVAFGNDSEALKNLKEISKIGRGNFIHIKNNKNVKEVLLDEIKEKSLIQQ